MQHPKQAATVHVETLDGELCIYDWQRMEVHNLNPTAARVWELCDGQTTPQQMATQLPGDLTPAQAEELVWLSLKRLEKAHLLENKVVQPAGRQVYTRREMLKGLGVAAVMLPVVSSIVAPGPAAAQSGGGGGTCPGLPIVRSTVATNITSTADETGTFYPFATPITAAEIAACGITQITVSWTGSPPTNTGAPIDCAVVQLAQSLALQARAAVGIDRDEASPVTGTSSNYWSDNEPYNGVRIGTSSFGGNWTVGQVTITLS
jgi:hypothetical protein